MFGWRPSATGANESLQMHAVERVLVERYFGYLSIPTPPGTSPSNGKYGEEASPLLHPQEREPAIPKRHSLMKLCGSNMGNTSNINSTQFLRKVSYIGCSVSAHCFINDLFHEVPASYMCIFCCGTQQILFFRLVRGFIVYILHHRRSCVASALLPFLRSNEDITATFYREIMTIQEV